MLWTLRGLIDSVNSCSTCIDGQWMPSRPVNHRYDLRGRVRAAWLVLTGRADAVLWPGGQ